MPAALHVYRKIQAKKPSAPAGVAPAPNLVHCYRPSNPLDLGRNFFTDIKKAICSLHRP